MIQLLINEFNNKKNQAVDYLELNALADNILEMVMQNYTNNVDLFVNKHNYLNDFEVEKWNIINDLYPNKKGIKLLDCGFGNGRDLIYGKELGYEVYGCELNINLYNKFIDENSANTMRIVNSDMRNLPFKSETFDIVRHNASFIHMPLIGPGYTIHKVIEESHRVLKSNGILYVFTKNGEGYQCLDTKEGLGNRPFQLLNNELLTELLLLHNFKIVHTRTCIRMRGDVVINWIEIIAIKI